ncbi:MAG: isocitrate/isopropylmalate family dehydrogenase [Lachnospiraceae bacterium]
MNYKIALIHGDGIGPEIVNEAKKILDKVMSGIRAHIYIHKRTAGRCIH